MTDRSDNRSATGGLKGLLDELPMDRLKDEAKDAFSSLSQHAVKSAGERITQAANKLTDVSEGGSLKGAAAKGGAEAASEGGSPVTGALKGGLSGLKDKAKEALGGGGSQGGGKRATKSTNIIEEIDVGVPISVAYNTWTEFQEYSNFMKKVEGVEQKDDTKVNFKAKIVWSHRTWESTILEQVPDERIIWRSKGQKGHVDGTVTFHELAPNLTRILLVLEYYPQGLFERTGNIWRAQGRRARLELKHFRRHVMMNVAQNPDDVEGWRGEIHDRKVERSHEEVLEDEDQQDETEGDEYEDDQGDGRADDQADDQYDDEDDSDEDESDESGDDGPEDEYDDEYDESDESGESEPDESDGDEGPEDGYDESEDENEDEERAPRRKRSRTR